MWCTKISIVIKIIFLKITYLEFIISLNEFFKKFKNTFNFMLAIIKFDSKI